MALQQRLRGRQAHAPGATYLAYTPNGKKLITAGVDNYCRIFTTGSDDEPVTVDDCQESNTAVVAGNGFFITGSEDGTVSKYSLEDNKFQEILVRTTLPVRDVALSPDGNWIAVASDELVVNVVSTKDMTKIRTLRDQPRAVKHVSFNRSGNQLAVSCTDGNVYMYNLDQDEPEMVKKVDGMIKSLETDAESSSRVLWHPDGRAFATPTALRDVQVMSTSDWERQRVFKTGHTSDITAAAWSPNGALLATTSGDLNLCLWDTKTQKVLKRYDDVKATILAMTWHPTENILSYTNNEGELFIHTDFVPEEHVPLLEKSTVSAPFFHDPSEGRAGAPNLAKGATTVLPERRPRQRDGTPDSLDDLLGPDFRDDEVDDNEDEDMNDFVVDDDGAGYASALNGHGKRPNNHSTSGLEPASKRRAPISSALFRPQVHEPFQPGSTPWRGNRRLLCCSLTGYIETVSQEGRHHTVSVAFYDEHTFRPFHFTDVFLYDKACLNENGALFACQPNSTGDGNPAMIYYRPHETWTTRTDWRTNLPTGESVTAIALSDSYVCVTTSTNYVRIYSLFGLPIRVYRQKSSPAVTCAAWRDYILTIGNGPMQADGSTQLLYTIENIKHDTVYQDADIVALPPNTTLTSVFFSAEGDPYIYDSAGVLLTLLNWRTSGQARWTPMLDTTLLSRLASGGKQESYWPVGVARDANSVVKFHCMIVKGREKYPSAPVPHLSDFGLEIPLSSAVDRRKKSAAERDVDAMSDDHDDDDDDDTADKNKSDSKHDEHEQTFILASTLHAQLSSTLSHTRPTAEQKRHLTALEVAIDRALLQLLGLECLAGEDHGMKALEIVGLMRDANGKMLDLAAKVADRYGREVLGEKIRELAERRVGGLDADGDDEY